MGSFTALPGWFAIYACSILQLTATACIPDTARASATLDIAGAVSAVTQAIVPEVGDSKLRQRRNDKLKHREAIGRARVKLKWSSEITATPSFELCVSAPPHHHRLRNWFFKAVRVSELLSCSRQPKIRDSTGRLRHISPCSL